MLNKVKCEFEIVEMPEEKIFSLGSKNKDEIIEFYDSELLEKTISNYFNKKYRDILYIIMSLETMDDATDSDTDLVLMKIDDLRKYLIKMFGSALNEATLKRYLNMLVMLESKVPIRYERSKGR